ncbi:MAG: TOBE domain-containing protein, partial [Nitrospinota bacterium]
QIGTPREVYHEPADTFVATFLGSPPMNLLEGEDCNIGFRPENLLPKETHGTRDKLVSFSARTTRVEYLGADRLVYGVLEGRFDGQKVIAKLSSTVAVPIQPGERHEFAVHEEDLKFFDRATGLGRGPAPLGG